MNSPFQTELMKDFRELRATVEKMGLFRASPLFFGFVMFQILALEFGGWFTVYYFGTSWLALLAASLLLVTAQVSWSAAITDSPTRPGRNTDSSKSPIPRNHLFLEITYSSKSPIPRNHLFLEITYSSKSPIPRNHLFLEITYSSKSPIPLLEITYSTYSSKSPIPRNHLFLEITYSSKSPIPRNHLFLEITYSSKSPILRNHLFLEAIYIFICF